MSRRGIILAAGESRRMGSPKALLEYRGETFLDRLVGLLSPFCDTVIVVLGYHADHIRAHAKREALYVVNPDPSRGMFSSLRTGIEALGTLPGETEEFVFTPVDLPAIAPATIQRLMDAPAAEIVIPRSDGRNGHPVRVGASLIPEFLALPPDAKASDVIRAHRASTRFLDVDDGGILRDIDVPGDYQELIEKAEADV